MKRIPGIAVMLFVVFLLPAAQAAERLHPMNVAITTWIGDGVFFIAQEKGFFRQNGLNVRLQIVEGNGDRRAGLVAKRFDGMQTTLDDAVVTRAQNIPVSVVAVVDESKGADGALAPNTITTIEGLKGKRVAVQPGFVNHFLLLYAMREKGLTDKDITIVPMDPDKASAAFAARAVDVAVTWEPYLSKVKELRPDAHVLFTSRDYPGIAVDVFLFRDDVIKNKPDQVRAFVRALDQAQAFLKNHPDEAHTIVARAFHLKPGEVKDMLKGVLMYDSTSAAHLFNQKTKNNLYDVARLVSELWQQEKLIATKPDPETFIRTDFLAKK